MSRAGVACAALVLLANCAAPDTTQGTGKLSDTFATPDWAKFTNSRPTQQRAITPADLVSADGHCAAPQGAATQAATEGVGTPEGDPLAGQGMPAVAGGIGLAMTECQVVERTGTPDRVDIGAEGTDRVVTMTVTQGYSPGLYRFRSGRLISIEHIDVPAPARSTKSSRPKKSSQVPIRGSQQ